jgi:hypothetical protein
MDLIRRSLKKATTTATTTVATVLPTDAPTAVSELLTTVSPLGLDTAGQESTSEFSELNVLEQDGMYAALHGKGSSGSSLIFQYPCPSLPSLD